MNRTALQHMMIDADTLSDEYDAILGYRTTHAGLVIAGAAGAFLPYGSTSSTIVYQNSLKAGGTALNTQGLTSSILGDAGGPTFDSDLGMKASNGSGDSAIRLSGYSVANQTALESAGQVSFQTRGVDFFALNANATGSTANDQTQVLATAFSFANWANANTGRISAYRQSDESFYIQTVGSGAVASNATSFRGWTSVAIGSHAPYFNSYRWPTDNTWVTVNIGWYTDGGANRRIIVSVDGQPLMTMVRSDTGSFGTGTLGQDGFVIGADGNFFNGPLAPFSSRYWNHGYIRNFQLSTQSPTEPAESSLGKLAIISDSIIDSKDWYGSAYRDLNIIARINRAAEVRGKKITTIYRQQNGGHQLDDVGTNYSFKNGANSSSSQSVNGTGTAMTDPRGTLKSQNPKTILINGGSNDVADYLAGGSITTTTFRDALRDHIKFFLGLDNSGWGGTDYSASPPGATVTHIFVTNICDRGKTWNSYAGCTATNGSPTITVLNNQSLFVNGDYVWSDSGVASTVTVSSGGGTSTLTLSGNYTGTTGAINLFNLSRNVNDSPLRTAAAQLRDVIWAVVNDFGVAYPSSTCQLHYVDTFNGMGGTDLYTGKILTSDEVHPNYAGVFRLGETIGAALAPYM